MAKIEQIELDENRSEIIADVKKLVEKYRAIFDWDVPEVNQNAADKLILVEVRKALDDIEKELLANQNWTLESNVLGSNKGLFHGNGVYCMAERGIKMNTPPPRYNPIDALGEAYESLLESALQKAHQSGTAGNLRYHTPNNQCIAKNPVEKADRVELLQRSTFACRGQ